MRIRAGFENSLYSAYSDVIQITTQPCPPPPSAPTDLVVVSATARTISLSWADNSLDNTLYRIQHSVDGGSWVTVTTAAADATSASFSTHQYCIASYQFRVVAYRSNDNSSSDPSNVVPANPIDCPIPPTNLNYTARGRNFVTLVWTDNDTNESGYFIDYSTNGGVSWASATTVGANVTSYTHSAICNTAYIYRVRTYRSSDSAYSAAANSLSVSTYSCTLAAATSLALSPGSVTMALSWVDNATYESAYYVERSTNNGSTWTQIASLTANETSYTDTGLTCGASYRYRIRAYSSVDNLYSSYTTSVNTATLVCLNAPTSLTITGSNVTDVSFSWSDTNSTETSYRLERSFDNGASWTLIAQLPANSTSHTSVVMCETYLYRVRAHRTADNSYSPYSGTVSYTARDCAPVIADPVCTLSPLVTLNEAYEAEVKALSGDGSRAFVNNGLGGNGPISIYDTNTGNLIDTVEANASGFLLPSEDGQRLFFGVVVAGINQIALWENGTITQITNSTNSYGYYVSASANTSATKLLYGIPNGSGTDTDLYIWEDGLGTREIMPEVAEITAAKLSGDGNTVVFVNHENLTGDDPSQIGMLYKWDEVNGIQALADFSSLDNEALTIIDYDFVVNEDASRIAFLYYKNLSGLAYMAVWTTSEGIVKIAPNDPVNIYESGSDGNVYSVIQWSGSGDRLLFASTDQNLTGYNADGSREYYVLDGGEIRQITSSLDPWAAEGNTDAAISSDGTKFLVTTYLPEPSANNLEPELVLALGRCELPPVTAPTHLVVDSTDETSLSLSWTENALDETEYRLERSDDGISWTEIAQPAANTSSYTDTGLGCATIYDYRVRAYRAGDTSYSAYSNVVTGTTDNCPPPAAPTSLNVSGTAQTSVSLSWTDNASDESSYSLERSLDGSNWTAIQAMPSNSTSYTDTTALCNTSYQYRVHAYRSGDSQFSAYSNVATGTTSACPPPNAPTVLTVASTGHTNINLAWTDNASDETGYRVERSVDNGATWTEIAQSAANATSFNDTTALCNTSYQYRIRAYRSADSQFSAYSNVVTGTTNICITLNAPTNIQQTANSQTGMSLSWTDNSTNESGYEIERALDGTNWTLLSNLPADSSSYTDSGLTCSTGYQYRVRSNHLGTATYSLYGTSALLTTAACPALVASVLSSTGATQNSISLSWTVDTNGTSFTLAYHNGTSWVNLGIFPSTSSSYTHTGLSCNRNYQYQITTFRATDSASVTSSAYSISTSACPPLAAPNAPIVVNTEPALVSLQIPALPATASSMSLERSTDGLSWTNLGNVSSNYLDTVVVCGSSYQYRVVALRSSDGVTSTSASAVALTDACPIPNVVGVYRAGLWIFVDSNNTAIPVNSFNFGDNSWQAIVGDWDGDGVDGVGIYRNGEFALRNIASADSPENRFNFGNAEAGWQAVVGDWNGDGIDSVGLYKDGLFILSNDNVNMQYRFNFGGGAGWQVVAGDWDGNGADGIALYKDGFWMLANDVNNPDASSFSISYGPNQAGWTATVGDWNGDGLDSIGLYANGIWRMRVNSISDATETSLNFGQTGDIPLAIFEN